MGLYNDLKVTASELIAEFGIVATLTKKTSAYDPVTGGNATTETDYDATVVVLSYNTQELSSTEAKNGILETDKKILFAPDGEKPSVDDSVLVNGTSYTILAVKDTTPADTTVLTECRGRA